MAKTICVKAISQQTTGVALRLSALMVCLCVQLCFGPPVLWADVNLAGIAEKTISSEQQVRNMEQSWSAEEKSLLSNSEQLRQRRETLQLEIKQLQQQLEHKQARLAFHQRRSEEAANLRQGLQRWFHSVATTLRADVDGGIPFLMQERRERLENLDKVLLSTDTAADEKLRRLLEVLQVEAEYGYTVEVYPDSIRLAGEQLQVDMIRLGRISLFFITPDARSCGVYDPATQGFIFLPAKYAVDIDKAIKSINGQSTDPLNLLPVGRIAP